MPITANIPGIFPAELSRDARAIQAQATSLTAFVGAAERGPLDEPVAVRDFPSFVRTFGESEREGAIGGAVREFFANGGIEAVAVRVARGARPARLARGAVKLSAASAGAWGNQLRLRLRLGLDGTFHLQVRDGVTGRIETHQDLCFDDSARRIDRVVNARSQLVRWTAEPPKAEAVLLEHAREPRAGKTTWSDDECSTKVEPAGRGSNGCDLSLGDFASAAKEASHQGLYALERADLFNLLVIPAYRPGKPVEPALWRAAASYCARRRAFLLVEPCFLERLGLANANAAVFFSAEGEPPSSAAVAGLLARTDAQRGPWRAPVGLGAALAAPRSLAGCDLSADGFPDDRGHVAVRRTSLFLEESLRRGTRWAAFEPNAEPLWRELRARVTDFLDGLHRQGAFAGSRADEAYFVTCGEDTTSPADLAHGRVNLVVGFAPVRPGEFATVSLALAAGQSVD